MNFVLVAGETSGDQLGAELIEQLSLIYPNARFSGVGGPLMQAAGLEAWFAAEELSVMGLFEVLRHLPRLLARKRLVISRSLALDNAVYIGIDAPDFNLGIAKRLKQAGRICVHYVSPSIWAWRQSRAMRIGASVDLVLCLFPFEVELYRSYQVDAEFVGHPLAEQIPIEPRPLTARMSLSLPPNAKILALLPGSRLSEVKSLAADFLAAAMILKRQDPKLLVVAAMASDRVKAVFSAAIKAEHAVILQDGQAQLLMQAADAVMVASGTAALEVMLAKKPMVIAYRVHALTYFIARSLGVLKVKYFSLPNHMHQANSALLVPELEQHHVTPQALVDALTPLMNQGLNSEQLHGFTQTHQSLIAPANAAASAIAKLLQKRRHESR